MGHEWQDFHVSVRVSRHNSDEDRRDEVFYETLLMAVRSLAQSMCAAAGKRFDDVTVDRG